MAQDTKSFLKSCYDLLGSIKLTVFLLLALAVGSLLGTLLPQGMSERELIMHFGETKTAWIQFFRLNDLYHSGWFQILIILLGANLVVCTLNRLPKTFKLLSRKDTEIRPEKLLKFSSHDELKIKRSIEQVQQALDRVIGRHFASPRVLSSAGPYSAVAEKGRWSYWMLYVIHFSVLLVLFGALIGSVFGFKGFMSIDEGTGSNVVRLFGNDDQEIRLPFEVRCDKFDVSFYENGAPKEFRSDLTIIENGKPELNRSIIVNDPLTYDGITFYQASYGSSLKDAEVEFTDTKTQQTFNLTLPFQKAVPVPGSDQQIRIVEFRDNFQGFGPALAIGLYAKDKKPTGSWVLADHPKFHGNQIGPYAVKVMSVNKSNYTGLQVKRDPGVWIVILGFVTLLIGMGTTFYTSHRKLWIWVSADNPTARIVIAGRTNKNSLAFENEFNDLCDRLRAELEGVGKETHPL